jgi:hypothetical protein
MASPSFDARSDPLFDGLVRWPWPGDPSLQVPVFLHDVAALAALFTADEKAIRELLPDARLRPITVSPGRCLFLTLACDYRRSDLGSYQEMALAVPVAIAGPQTPGGGFAAFAPTLLALARGLGLSFTAWIWRMPVSSRRACEAGQRLAGFPKTLAHIAFECDSSQATATLTGTDGTQEVRLSVRGFGAMKGHRPSRELRLRSVTLLQGLPVVSLLRVREAAWRNIARPDALELALGRGELADALRGLRLGRRPWFAHLAEQAHAVLFPPRNLIDE